MTPYTMTSGISDTLKYINYIKQNNLYQFKLFQKLTSTNPWRILTNIATTKLILAAVGKRQLSIAEIAKAIPNTL